MLVEDPTPPCQDRPTHPNQRQLAVDGPEMHLFADLHHLRSRADEQPLSRDAEFLSANHPAIQLDPAVATPRLLSQSVFDCFFAT